MRTTTFAAILAEHAARQSTKCAVVAGDTRLTYAELDNRVAGVATRLAQAGVRADDTVSSQLPNCAEAMVLAFAADYLDAVHNPITTISGQRGTGGALRACGKRSPARPGRSGRKAGTVSALGSQRSRVSEPVGEQGEQQWLTL